MDIEFVNPGVDYMIQRIMDVQTEAESAFWSEPLYHFYPQLDKAYAISLRSGEGEGGYGGPERQLLWLGES